MVLEPNLVGVENRHRVDGRRADLAGATGTQWADQSRAILGSIDREEEVDQVKFITKTAPPPPGRSPWTTR